PRQAISPPALVWKGARAGGPGGRVKGGRPVSNLSLPGNVVKFFKSLELRSGEFLRRWLPLHRPSHDVDVVFIQQRFEPGKIRRVPMCVVVIEEAADHQVGFTRAAVPSPEARPGEANGKVAH